MESTPSKWRERTATVGVLIFLWWGITYIPVVRNFAPGFPAPVQTVQYDVTTDFTDDGAIKDTTKIEDACHHIPFLLRPIMRLPDEVFVDAMRDGQVAGRVDVNCHTGERIGDVEIPSS